VIVSVASDPMRSPLGMRLFWVLMIA